VERARRRQRHLQSDLLGTMACSQATAGLCGGASRQWAIDKQRAHKARSILGSKAGSSAWWGSRCSPRALKCNDEAVVKSLEKWDTKHGRRRGVAEEAGGSARCGSRLEQLRLLGGAIRGWSKHGLISH
jgi:hypothetical protein